MAARTLLPSAPSGSTVISISRAGPKLKNPATWRRIRPARSPQDSRASTSFSKGDAARVTDRTTLEEVARLYREGGWPAEVEGDAFTAPFSAPSAGPPPWHLYRFRLHTAFGVATAEPYGATRWRFDR